MKYQFLHLRGYDCQISMTNLTLSARVIHLSLLVISWCSLTKALVKVTTALLVFLDSMDVLHSVRQIFLMKLVRITALSSRPLFSPHIASISILATLYLIPVRRGNSEVIQLYDAELTLNETSIAWYRKYLLVE